MPWTLTKSRVMAIPVLLFQCVRESKMKQVPDLSTQYNICLYYFSYALAQLDAG